MHACEFCQQFCCFSYFKILTCHYQTLLLNVSGILSSRETSKMLLSWKIKTHIFLTCSTLVVFPDEFICKKEQGALKCLICTMLQHMLTVYSLQIFMFTCGGPQIRLKSTTVASKVFEACHFVLKFMQICKNTQQCSTYE